MQLNFSDRPPVRPVLSQHKRRRAGAVGLAAAIAVAMATGSTAYAAGTTAAGGTRGDPQPELALFNVGGAGGTNGSGTVLPDGTLVLATLANNGDSARVCMLHPGDRSCAASSTLHFAGADLSGTAEVLGTGGTDVSVVISDSERGDVLYNSTNDGKTFSSTYVSTGDVLYGVTSGTSVSGQLVVATVDPHSGIEVQAYGPTGASPGAPFANPSSDDDAPSITNYHGGVLEASDNLTNTYVKYAAAGRDFNATSSYTSVGTFNRQVVTAVSGSALLTDPNGSITGGELLRFFNGTSFGPAYKVPEPYQGDDGYFGLQDVGGVVHVFFLNRRHGYDIYSETTRDGVHWSGRTIYNTAVTTGLLVPVLAPDGAGVVFEADTGTNPLLAQPILNPQSVSVSLAHNRVKTGTSTKLSGHASPMISGQRVVLQRLSSGLWYYVNATHESAAGKFSFKVPGTTHTYRAVVADKAGYYLYGYSNSVTLTAVAS